MNRDEALLAGIEIMEKEIVYFKGKKRERTMKKYLELLRSRGKNYSLDEPIYFDRM